MWKIIFEHLFFIEPASGNFIVDLLLPSILSQILYQPSFDLVGEMYETGIISSRESGSFFHWFFRLMFAYIIIFVFNLIVKYFIWILVSILVICIILFIRYIINKK
ncbi:MAG: hypothetical protein WC006_07905 [Bacilli bacterium]